MSEIKKSDKIKALNEFKKTYKNITWGKDVKRKTEVIPSGSLALDLAMGSEDFTCSLYEHLLSEVSKFNEE